MNEKILIGGWDIGLTGAIAIIQVCGPENKLIQIFDNPLTPNSRRKSTDIDKLHNFLLTVSDSVNYFNLERIHSSPRDGHVGSFTFGMQYGIAVASLKAFGVAIRYADPATWKLSLGLTGGLKGKPASSQLASKLFPSSDAFKRLKDHNRAEAALLASLGTYALTKALNANHAHFKPSSLPTSSPSLVLPVDPASSQFPQKISPRDD